MRHPSAYLSLAAIGAAVALGLGPVLWIGLGESLSGMRAFDSFLWQVLRFTVLQAGLSAILSIVPAVPLSWALFRAEFPGRGLILHLFALPLAIPAIVAILGIVAIFGQSGAVATATGSSLSIYGLTGILIAHVFFNLPLAVRLFVRGLESVPAETWRLAAQVGFTDRDRFRIIGWPAIAGRLPATASLIFLLCAASFAVVLTLGGGPRATTLEVAIYQALRFDFDPARAGTLALVQLVLCGLTVAFATRFVLDMPAGAAVVPRRYGLNPRTPTFAEIVLIAAATLYVAAPVAAVASAGLAAQFDWMLIGRAAATSLALATVSSLTSVLLALPLALASARDPSPVRQSTYALASVFGLVIPPAVLATGWFILAIGLGYTNWLAFLLVAAMNALMALPFTFGTLSPAARARVVTHDRLCSSLGLKGWDRLRRVDLPLLARGLAFAAALGFVLSLGDLTAISLFGSQELVTLPSLIHGQMGSYRVNAAAATALVLMTGAIAVVAAAERIGQRA